MLYYRFVGENICMLDSFSGGKCQVMWSCDNDTMPQTCRWLPIRHCSIGQSISSANAYVSKPNENMLCLFLFLCLLWGIILHNKKYNLLLCFLLLAVMKLYLCYFFILKVFLKIFEFYFIFFISNYYFLCVFKLFWYIYK
jgi:hypothetical protein